MKSQMSFMTVLALATLSSTASAAKDKALPTKQVPQPVHNVFQKAYPAAKEIKDDASGVLIETDK